MFPLRICRHCHKPVNLDDTTCAHCKKKLLNPTYFKVFLGSLLVLLFIAFCVLLYAVYRYTRACMWVGC